MKKNFIQKHSILVALILFCFLLVPSVRDSYCKENPTPNGGIASIGNQPAEKSVDQQGNKKKIVLDAGHGGYDPGSISAKGDQEKALALAITLRIGELLEAKHYEVIYTRTDDNVHWPSENAEDLFERSRIANETNADAFVSIHMNYSDDYQDEIKGNEIWVSYKDEKSVSFANTMNTSLLKAKGSSNRGIKDERTMGISLLQFNKIPSILIETGFLSNAEDTAYLKSTAGIEELSTLITNGIIEFTK